MSKYAYLRVSSKDQNLSRQLEAMNTYGIKSNNIYIDKQSGSSFNRTAYNELLKIIKKKIL